MTRVAKFGDRDGEVENDDAEFLESWVLKSLMILVLDSRKRPGVELD